MADVQGKHTCDCKRSFATAAALAQNRNDSPRHQNSQGQRTASKNIIPALVTEDERRKHLANLVAGTEPKTSATSSSMASPSQKQPTQQQQKINGNHKGRQARTTAVSRAYGPRGWYYNPYREPDGLDHTQCSSDCDWCGKCSYF
ncbi:hypothetical protein F5X98DRAFT_387759 [Xylaria grammica]|nr:hypothetical protein F5X98DRAFT_387759 [Xylaria grammica]